MNALRKCRRKTLEISHAASRRPAVFFPESSRILSTQDPEIGRRRSVQSYPENDKNPLLHIGILPIREGNLSDMVTKRGSLSPYGYSQRFHIHSPYLIYPPIGHTELMTKPFYRSAQAPAKNLACHFTAGKVTRMSHLPYYAGKGFTSGVGRA